MKYLTKANLMKVLFGMAGAVLVNKLMSNSNVPANVRNALK